MTKTAVGALVAILVGGTVQSEEVPDQIHVGLQVIRVTLLGHSVWTYELRHLPGPTDAVGGPSPANSGKAWFEELDGKVIGHLQDSRRCNSQVQLQADGFKIKTCAGEDVRFVRNGNEFTASISSYEYTIRPAP